MANPRYVKITEDSSEVEVYIAELADRLQRVTIRLGEMLEDEKDFTSRQIGTVFYNGIINYVCQGVHLLAINLPKERKAQYLDDFKRNLANAIDTYEEMHRDDMH